MPVQVAVVGCGGFFRSVHAGMLQRLERSRLIRVRWLADPDAGNLAAARRLFPAAGGFGGADELLAAERPDAAIILAAEQAKPAIFRPFAEHGIAFLTEKPAAVSAVSLRAFLRAYPQLPPHLVGWNRCFAPAVLRLRDFAERNRTRISLIAVDFLRHGQATPLPGVGNFGHCISALRLLGGEITTIRAMTGCVRHPKARHPFSFAGVFRFTSGVLGQFTYNAAAGLDAETYRVMAHDASAVAQMGYYGDGDKAYLEYRDRNLVVHQRLKGFPQRVNGIEGEYLAFLASLGGGQNQPHASLSDSLLTHQTMERFARALARAG